MQVGIIGLGKMGSGFALHLLERGYEVVGFDQKPEVIKEFTKQNGVATESLEKLVSALKVPRLIILSIPHNSVGTVIFGDMGLVHFLSSGDFIIDATNSYYKNSIIRNKTLAEKGIDYLDAGVSGGPSGALKGACFMIGGDEKVYKRLEPIFRDLSANEGYSYMGPSGAGHFVKMVHNGIEYALIQAYTEGFELLQAGPYKELDLKKISRIWNNGSVVASFLLDIIEAVFAKNQTLDLIEGFVEDLGEGRWSVKEAIDDEIPADAIAHALFARFRSRQKDSFAAKLTAAMRHEFGGHPIKEIQ